MIALYEMGSTVPDFNQAERHRCDRSMCVKITPHDEP